MLDEELAAHLGYEKHSPDGINTGNSRNETFSKSIQTKHGEQTIEIPRDHNREFEPVVVPKHQSRSLSIEHLVISLYGKGMSVSDIEDELRDIYRLNLLTSATSLITNKVTQSSIEWQNRPRERFYTVVWMDGIVFKVRESGKIINKTVYLRVGLNDRGYKEVLDMWIGKTENSSFGMSVLTNLKTRDVEDILITIRKYTKSKLSFPTDEALRKSVCLAITEIEKK